MPMKDRSKLGASIAPALIAVGCVLAGDAGYARAEQAASEAETAPVPASVEAAPPPSPGIPPAAAEAVATPPAPASIAPPEPASLVPPPPAAEPSPSQSWFARPPLTLVVGEGNKQFKLTVFGFAEADFIYDSTQSYNDAIGSSIVARDDTLAGRSSRSQFSMRNSRLGFAFESPTLGSIRPTAVLETDFFGHQDSPPETSESTYFNSPTLRVRHAYVKLQSPYLDLLMGQTYDLFGWQNHSYPCTAEFLGIPNQLFSRNSQVRLSRHFNEGGAVSVEIAASAGRPAQRDSQAPDGSAGLRVVLGRWLGITTPGNVGTKVEPAFLGVSGIVRQLNVNAFTPPPARNSNSATGWGLAVDAFLPVIPAASDSDRSNRLTLTGSFVTGTGIADLITSGGNAQFPKLPNPRQDTPPPVYQPNIVQGLATFDADGVLHTINWMAFRVGLQYYLPPTGRLVFSANFTQSHSDNMSKLYPKGGAEIELLNTTVRTSRYADVNLFWDATPSLRLGLSGQYTQVEYLDNIKPRNFRGMAQSVYVF
jgi:hypothetical protein